MKWLKCETIDKYTDINARIEAALGIPNNYFSGYARSPREIAGMLYLPITDDAMSALSDSERHEMIDTLPQEVEDEID
jgi:hypothetical protein